MRIIQRDGPGAWSIFGAGVAAAALLVAAVGGGCTSDPENSVGSPLVGTVFDTVLAPVLIDQLVDYSAFEVRNGSVPVHRQQILYMGSEKGTRSTILANFDFSFTETPLPDTLSLDDFAADNIKTVKFSLIKPRPYHALEDSCYLVEDENGQEVEECVPVSTGRPSNLHYRIRQLQEPYHQAEFAGFPNAVPATRVIDVNSDIGTSNDSNEPFISIYPEVFVDWIEAGAPIGLAIDFDENLSELGLIGYASSELRRFSQFDDLQVGTVVGPNLRIEFQDNRVYLMENYADTSTWEEVPAPPDDPADGIMVRSGLRSYPALYFDLGAIPAGARINRAVLELTNDPSASMGPVEDLAVSEIDTAAFGDPHRTITMTDFRAADFLFLLSGERRRDPETLDKLELEVTPAVQRYVNRVTEGTRGIMISAWEFPPLSGGDRSVASGRVPVDFYFQVFSFYGTGATAEQRPKLNVTYSLVDEIGEGGP